VLSPAHTNDWKESNCYEGITADTSATWRSSPRRCGEDSLSRHCSSPQEDHPPRQSRRRQYLSDYHSDETERQISITTSLLFCEWKGVKAKSWTLRIYRLHREVIASLRVADTAVVLLKAVERSGVGTEIVARYTSSARTGGLPDHKLDQENAVSTRSREARETLSHDILPLQFPLNAGARFRLHRHVVRMKLLKFAPGGNASTPNRTSPGKLRRVPRSCASKCSSSSPRPMRTCSTVT